METTIYKCECQECVNYNNDDKCCSFETIAIINGECEGFYINIKKDLTNLSK